MSWDSSLDPTTAPHGVLMRWSEMSPAERSDEMKRRQAKAKANRKKNGGYKCKKCDKVFPDKYKYANHVRYEHPKGKTSGKRKGAQSDGDSTQSTETQEQEKHIWYLFGKVETWIDEYGARSGVPRATLAKGLAALLRHQEGG